MTLVRKSPRPQPSLRALDGVLLLLCGVPLLYAEPFVFPFVVIKVYVFQALVGVAAALWLMLALRRPPRLRPALSPIRAAALVLLAVLLVTSLAGVDPGRSLWSSQERSLGLIALLHFAFLGWILSDVSGDLPTRRYLTASSLVSVIAAVFALVEIAAPATFLRPDATAVVRPGSFFRNPTFLAAYLLPHIFIMLHLAAGAFRGRSRNLALAWSAAVVLEIAVVFLTQTRGAILGLAAGFLALAGYLAIRGSQAPTWGPLSVRTASRATLLVIAIAATVVFLTRGAPFWQSVPGLRRLTRLTASSADIQPRLLALRAFVKAALERPLLGYGFENGGDAFNRHYDPKLLRYGAFETYFDKPHNVFLEYAVAGGAPGLAALIGLLFVTAWSLFRRDTLREFAPFGLGLLTAHITNNLFIFDSFGSYLGLFLVLGFVDGQARTAPATAPASAPAAAPATPRRRADGPARNRPAVAALAAVGAAAWIAVNAGVLLANHRQYQMLTAFSNHQPELAVRSFDASLAVPAYPFRYETRRSFVATFSQLVAQGAGPPDAAGIAARAMREARSAVREEPRDYFLRVSFASAAGTLSRFDRSYLTEGEDQVREALRLSPGRQEAYFEWVKLKSLESRPDEALALMEQAVALDPGVGECQFYYALLAFDAGRTAAAFHALELAGRLGRPPRTAAELRVVAAQYAAAGGPARAIDLYNQALALEPDDLETRWKLGLVYYSAGRRDDARRCLGAVAQAADLTGAPGYAQLKPILDDLGIPTAK